MRARFPSAALALILCAPLAGCSAMLDFDSIGDTTDGGSTDTGAPGDGGSDTNPPDSTVDSSTCVSTSDFESTCDGVDDDCDGAIDEGEGLCVAGTVCHGSDGCESQPVELNAGPLHICARYSDGSLDCWGYNGNRQAVPTNENEFVPSPTWVTDDAVLVRAGSFHTCVKPGTRQVYCYGQLPLGTAPVGRTPIEIPGESSAASLAAPGGAHTCVGAGLSGVFCRGTGSNGQIGDGAGADASVFTLVSGGLRASALESNLDTTCLINNESNVYCWGLTPGVSSLEPTLTPERVTEEPLGFTSLSVGPSHVCGLADGAVYCWGMNDRQQVNGNPEGVISAPFRSLDSATEVSAGGGATCAISEGRVLCWGNNTDGIITGDAEPDMNYTEPTSVPIEEPYVANDIAVGGSFACAIVDDWKIVCWGNNEAGQLGRGTTSSGAERPGEAAARVGP